ncbi:hypothetical protein PR048_003763 [Dryococelus australis]|uniref:DDE-1 domain-containing protein n=1 Tax=Dryococelus australis TaxID=614101 RepID=A0ABQ9IQN2_9NEOP|nr:hypothetical protein PR048_003763 [Dryococelus australis]
MLLAIAAVGSCEKSYEAAHREFNVSRGTLHRRDQRNSVEKDRHHFSPSQIIKTDETGISTVPNKPPKILSPKVLLGNSYLPCWFSLESEKMQFLNKGYHQIVLLLLTPQTRCKQKSLRQFCSSISCPMLTLLEMVKANNVHILVIPPPTSHRLQALDISFMRPFSTFYSQTVKTWLRNKRKVHLERLQQLFQHSGACLFNPCIFPEEAFEVAEATNRPQEAAQDRNDEEPSSPTESRHIKSEDWKDSSYNKNSLLGRAKGQETTEKKRETCKKKRQGQSVQLTTCDVSVHANVLVMQDLIEDIILGVLWFINQQAVILLSQEKESVPVNSHEHQENVPDTAQDMTMDNRASRGKCQQAPAASLAPCDSIKKPYSDAHNSCNYPTNSH